MAHLEDAAQAKPNPGTPSHRAGCGAGGTSPPPPICWHWSRPLRRGRAWRREHVPAAVPRGMETPGTGASLLISQESTSAPEPCSCGSQDSTAGDGIASGAPLVPQPILHSTREPSVRAAPGAGSMAGRGQGDAAAAPSPRGAGCGWGHVFCISSIPAEQHVWQQARREASAGAGLISLVRSPGTHPKVMLGTPCGPGAGDQLQPEVWASLWSCSPPQQGQGSPPAPGQYAGAKEASQLPGHASTEAAQPPPAHCVGPA